MRSVRSLEIALYTAIAATALGTLAAFVLTRVTRFKGRTLFGGLVTAPLVMPEVITGLSLLLLFVAMAQLIGWPAQRGHPDHLDRPYHLLFGIRGRGGVVASARAGSVDRGSGHGSGCQAVEGVLPDHHSDDRTIAGRRRAMMSFALSLDDLVLASFVSGPGSTTLPMEVFSAVRLGVKPEINAVASLILLTVSLATFIAWYFARRAETKRKRAIKQAMQSMADEASGSSWKSA
jgi:putrescine transport system permease protein